MFDPTPTVSASRTYLISIYEVACPNKINFERVQIPEQFINDSAQARNYYLLSGDREGLRIMASVAIEDFIFRVNDVLGDSVVLKPKPMTIPIGSPNFQKDVEKALLLLDKWNAEQKEPAPDYTLCVEFLIWQLDFQKELSQASNKALSALENFIKQI